MPQPQALRSRYRIPALPAFARAPRWHLGITRAVLLVALYLALTQNQAFADAVWHSLPHPFGAQEWRIAGSAALVMYGLMVLILLPFAAPRLFKPAATLWLLVAAGASYFMDGFGTVIDRSMMVNVLQTDVREARDLLRPAFFLHVLLQGVLPALLLWRIDIGYAGFLRSLRDRCVVVAVVLLGTGALLATQYNELVFWGRENRDVRLYVNPVMPVAAAIRVVREQGASHQATPPVPIATDAVRASAPQARPLLVVLVVGETARAANFQLNGYARATNPRLSAVPDLINYADVSACGTSTAESVPCLFSRLTQADFSRTKARAEENVLDVLQRVGVEVSWRDNNSGCQGVCQRIDARSWQQQVQDAALCNRDGCHDGVLLQALDEAPPAAGAARLLVLHQQGSHGPAYFKRYPASARHFVPDCRDERVQRCTREETVNAYDNTLVYTDQVLADLIDRLRQQQEQVDSVLLYVSDHGESLGENGLYLHGLPYRMAPREQTQVPMLAWFSAHAAGSLDLDLACVRASRGNAYSHDHLFSSLLALFAVQTQAYDADADLFAACRRQSAGDRG